MNQAHAVNPSITSNTSDMVLLAPECEAITMQKLPPHAIHIIQQNFHEMLLEAHLAAEHDSSHVDRETGDSYPSSEQLYYQALLAVDTQYLPDILADLNGDMDCKNIAGHILNDLVFYQGRIASLPEFGVYHYFRTKRHVKDHNNILASTLYLGEHAHFLQHLDLRQIADVLHQSAYCDAPEQLVAECFLNGQLLDVYQVWQNDLIWPFFVQNADFLDEILGLSPKKQTHNINSANAQQKALRLLQCFPSVPTLYVPKLLEWALSDGKAWKHQAQVVLAKLPTAHEYAIKALTATKPQTRQVAAKWLIALKRPDSIPPLYLALSHEKQNIIRVSMLAALLQLGENMDDYFQPEALLSMLQKTLKSNIPDSLVWLKPQAMPALTWQNQQVIHPDIVYGLLVLATQYQEPAGSAFFRYCIAKFSQDSQQSLAAFVLSSFIQEDLRGLNAKEALAQAIIEAPIQWQEEQDLYQDNPSDYGDYANKTLAMVVDSLQQEKMGTPMGSAVDCCGILALCYGIDSATAIAWIAPYWQQQTMRKMQRHALLQAIAQSNDAQIVSFLLSLQHEHAMVSSLLSDIAHRHGLSIHQLPDVFIPIPQNSLEQQIICSQQSTRLFHAMCAQKTWSVADWQQYYANHALMKTLIHRLVWLNVDAQGHVLQSFQINAQGELLNAQGYPIQLLDNSRIMIAHGLLLPEQAREDWQGFERNSPIAPLFPQFAHQAIMPMTVNHGRLIADYSGWDISHVNLHEQLLAKGYLPYAIDQGHFYAKHCPDLDVYAAINVSHIQSLIQGVDDNNNINKINDKVFLHDLCFIKEWDWPHPLLLNSISPILLAESYVDYVEIAQQTQPMTSAITTELAQPNTDCPIKVNT